MARYCRIITRIINDFSFRDNWLLVVVPADLIFLRRFSNFFPFSFSFFYFLDERRRTSLVRTNYNGKNLRGEYHQTKMWCFDFDTFALLLFEYRLLIQFRHVDAFRRKKKKSEREKKKKIKNFSSFFFLFPPPSLPILFLDDLSSILISVSSFGLSPPPFRPSTLRFITFSCFNLFTVIYRTFFFYHRNVKRWTAAFSVEHGGLTIHRHGSATTTQHFLR